MVADNAHISVYPGGRLVAIWSVSDSTRGSGIAPTPARSHRSAAFTERGRGILTLERSTGVEILEPRCDARAE